MTYGSLGVLLRKELLFQWRTRRLLVLVGVGVALGLLSTGTELGTGVLLELVRKTSPPGTDLGPIVAMLDRQPTLLGAAQNYFKNFSFLSVGVLLVGMGSVAAEAQAGELAVVLVRPVSRIHVVLSKVAGLTVSAWAGLFSASLTFVLVSLPTLGMPRLLPFLGMVLLLGLFLALYAGLTVLASALARSTAPAIGLAALFVALSNASGFLPLVGSFLPEGCFKLAAAVAFGKTVPVPGAITVLANLVLLVAVVTLAGLTLRRREV